MLAESVRHQQALQRPLVESRPLRIGSDCAAVNAVGVAAKNLDVHCEHTFAFDITENCGKTLRANSDFKELRTGKEQGDITKRVHTLLDCDLFYSLGWN